MLYAVVSEKFLLLFIDTESSNYPFVFQFQRSFSCAILNKTKHLHVKDSFLNLAPISANLLVVGIGSANVALQLNFDELSFNNKAKYFY